MAQRLRMAPDAAQKAGEDKIKHSKGITLRAQRGGTVTGMEEGRGLGNDKVWPFAWHFGCKLSYRTIE